jgi:hypothetical protein
MGAILSSPRFPMKYYLFSQSTFSAGCNFANEIIDHAVLYFFYIISFYLDNQKNFPILRTIWMVLITLTIAIYIIFYVTNEQIIPYDTGVVPISECSRYLGNDFCNFFITQPVSLQFDYLIL